MAVYLDVNLLLKTIYNTGLVGQGLTLSILNLPLSSSSTISRELLSKFSTCRGWKGWQRRYILLLLWKFHDIFILKPLCVEMCIKKISVQSYILLKISWHYTTHIFLLWLKPCLSCLIILVICWEWLFDLHDSYTTVFACTQKSKVWEITGAEFSKSDAHTAGGISIRFPRCTKMRDDKSWKEATNLPRLKVSNFHI